MNKYFQWILHFVVGLVCYIFFVVCFFPIEPLVQNLLAEVEKKSKGAYRLSVGEMDASLFFQSTFKKVKLITSERGMDKILADIPEIKSGLKYWPLLSNKLQGSLSISGKNGSQSGWFKLSENDLSVDTVFKKFSLSYLPVIQESLQVPLEGKIDGRVELSLDFDQQKNSTGKIGLSFIDFKIMAHKLNIKGLELDLPELILSGVEGGKLTLSLDKNRIKLQNLEFPGPDVSANLKGSYQLNEKAALSILNFNGEIKISEEYSKNVPEMVLMMVDKYKTETGAFPLSVSGRLKEPVIKIGDFTLPL